MCGALTKLLKRSSMDNKLNTCPSCGCLPHVDMWYTEDGVLYRVKCDNKNCPECTTWFNTCEGAAMRWNSMIGIPHSPKETRIPVEFRPCPDCGCDEYPYLSRGIVHTNGKPLHVKAECYRCGWQTVYHKSVKECAKEWNEAEV